MLGLLQASPMLPVETTAGHKATATHPCAATCGSSEEDGSDVTCCVSHSESKLEQPKQLELVLWQCLPWDPALVWEQPACKAAPLSPAPQPLAVPQGREKRCLPGMLLSLPGEWGLCAPAQGDPSPQAKLPGQDGTQQT